MKEEQPSKFISLPMEVTVTKFDCDLKPYIHKKNELFENVVYISGSAEDLLIDFIEEPMHKKIEKNRKRFFSGYNRRTARNKAGIRISELQ